jgi:hypothetical protein
VLVSHVFAVFTGRRGCAHKVQGQKSVPAAVAVPDCVWRRASSAQAKLQYMSEAHLPSSVATLFEANKEYVAWMIDSYKRNDQASHQRLFTCNSWLCVNNEYIAWTINNYKRNAPASHQQQLHGLDDRQLRAERFGLSPAAIYLQQLVVPTVQSVFAPP